MAARRASQAIKSFDTALGVRLLVECIPSSKPESEFVNVVFVDQIDCHHHHQPRRPTTVSESSTYNILRKYHHNCPSDARCSNDTCRRRVRDYTISSPRAFPRILTPYPAISILSAAYDPHLTCTSHVTTCKKKMIPDHKSQIHLSDVESRKKIVVVADRW
jgi:hypothetical protein